MGHNENDARMKFDSIKCLPNIGKFSYKQLNSTPESSRTKRINTTKKSIWQEVIKQRSEINKRETKRRMQ